MNFGDCETANLAGSSTLLLELSPVWNTSTAMLQLVLRLQVVSVHSCTFQELMRHSIPQSYVQAPEFRDKLDALLPAHINYSILEGRYIPNLVARPFEMTKDLARSILEVVPLSVCRLLDDDAVGTSMLLMIKSSDVCS